MSDRRLRALIYRIDHAPTVIYDNAGPLEYENDSFRARVEKGRARFDLKGTQETVDQAQAIMTPVIKSWELSAGLNRGPGEFRFVFERAEFEEYDPTRDAKEPSSTSHRQTVMDAVLTVERDYPPAPADLAVNELVDLMYHQYVLHSEGKALLGAMANFCLSVLEKNAKGGQRSAAAKKYHIESKVLSTLGNLTAEKGGSEARKADGVERPYTAAERRWTKEAVKAIIRRAAQIAYDPDGDYKKITFSDLPPL